MGLFVAAAISVLTTLGIIACAAERDDQVLPGRRGRSRSSPTASGSRSSPIRSSAIWPLINGTFLVTGIAILVAIPLGLGSAIYLSEYAKPRTRG